MKRPTLLIGLALLSIALVACGGVARNSSPMEEPAPMVQSLPEMSLDESAADTAGSPAFAGETVQTEPLVIRTANLTLVVEDPAASADEIAQLAEELGGFVVVSNVYLASYDDSSDTVARASITIRVPSDSLDEALERIEAPAIEVRDRNVRGEDVTQQYTDLQSRLRNLQSAETQLLQIMENATDTEDVLQVFDNLTRVREQIEVLQGQINYYEDSARLSSIAIDLIPDALAQPLQIGGWHPEGTAKQAIEALIRALQTIVDAGIWALICVVPVALLFGLPGFFAVRSAIRRRRASKAEEAEKE